MDSAKQILDELSSIHLLSDSEIARRVDSSQPTISRIRNDKVADCSANLYIALCQLIESLRSAQKNEA